MKTEAIPVWERYAITIAQASEYFGIGEKKLRSIVNENMDAEFIFKIGVKVMIKRQMFERYLDKISSV